MKYEVLSLFTDGQDGGYEYKPGDVYPRAGLKPTAERIEALSTNANKRGIVLIQAIETIKEEHTEKVEKGKKTTKKAKK